MPQIARVYEKPLISHDTTGTSIIGNKGGLDGLPNSVEGYGQVQQKITITGASVIQVVVDCVIPSGCRLEIQDEEGALVYFKIGSFGASTTDSSEEEGEESQSQEESKIIGTVIYDVFNLYCSEIFVSYTGGNIEIPTTLNNLQSPISVDTFPIYSQLGKVSVKKVSIPNTSSTDTEDEEFLDVCSTGDKLSTNCLDSSIDLNFSIDDITNGSVASRLINNKERYYWTGTGVFDKLMGAYNENIRIEHDNGRIVGAEYAKSYTTLLTTAMSQAIDLEVKNKELQIKSLELCLKKQLDCAKLIVEQKKLIADLKLTKLKQANMLTNTRVLERQITGFDDNIQLKLLQAQLDSYAMIFSSGMLDDLSLPDVINKSSLTKEYQKIEEILRSNKNKKFDIDKRIPEPRSNIPL